MENKKNSLQNTGRITDTLHNWKVLPRDMKGWQYACLCCGVGIQCLLLIFSVVILAGEFF